MKSLSNIDKSSFRKGEYVGYPTTGFVRIRREGKLWATYDSKLPRMSATTLRELNKLVALA